MAQEGSNNIMYNNREFDIEAGNCNGEMEINYLQINAHREDMADERNNSTDDLDIDILTNSLERILQDVPQYMCNLGHPGRISRIPENLSEVDKKAYEPYFLSIGPYHHGKPQVQKMERKKRDVLRCFLDMKPEITIKDYLEEIQSTEPAARSFYSDVEMDSERFVRMLLLDSLFILTLFCGMPISQERITHNEDLNASESEGMDVEADSENRQMLEKVDESKAKNSSGGNRLPRLFAPLFEHDLFLLENQLPFFVLQKIYALAYGNSETQFIDNMKNEVGYMVSKRFLSLPMVMLPNEEIHHLLHLCHLYFRPTLQQESTSGLLLDSSQMFRLGSAVQLYESGISFEPRSASTLHSLLDITFGTSGKMTMPCLHVDDNGNSLLRNLVAMEQMKYPRLGLEVSAYVVLLLHLLTIPEDVELLRRKGIIQHHLASDKEMVYLVNRLSVGLSFNYIEDDYSLKHVFHELKRYSEGRVPRWKAWLKHRHFTHPWTVISFLSASILLLLTVLQTYYTVYSYYKPNMIGNS